MVSDLHGDWPTFFPKIDRLKITDCEMYCVGDVGIGFCVDRRFKRHDPVQEQKLIQSLDRKFSERNIVFYATRGNHDAPRYFDGSIDLDNFKLLPDYTTKNINGETWLFVGGAISVDKYLRLAKGWTWFRGEEFVPRDKYPKCDVLVTHQAPSYLGPNDKTGLKGKGWLELAPDPQKFWEELCEERKEIDRLIRECGAKRHYCGHLHVKEQVEHQGCLSSILDILEIVEHRNDSH